MGWIESRVSRSRTGSSRRAPGPLEACAQFVKLLLKENLVPDHVDRALFVLAPALAFIPALLAVAVLPLGPPIALGAGDIDLGIADVEAGILFVFLTVGIAVQGAIYGSFASNNKFSLLGGMRGTAQFLAFHPVWLLSIAGILILSGSLRVEAIVESQQGSFLSVLPRWNAFVQPIGFVVGIAAMLAIGQRRPTDLARSSSELVGGYTTEYSGANLALFGVAESFLALSVAMLTTHLFLGGWLVPGLDRLELPSALASIVGAAAFGAKTAVLLFATAWIRQSLPRVRHDLFAQTAWRFFFPLALPQIVVPTFFLA